MAVQTVVARIETDAGAGGRAECAGPRRRPGARARRPAKPRRRRAPEPPRPAPPSPAPAAPAMRVQAGAGRPRRRPRRTLPDPGANGSESVEERLRRRSTPLVRKMAAEHNLDLSAIPGTGLAGRVTKNDMLSYIESGRAGAAGRRGARRPHPPRRPLPSRPRRAPPAPAHAATVEPWQGDRVEPWSRIRKLTAEHMVMSRRVSPHVNTIFEIDYTRVAQLRAKKKKEYADRGREPDVPRVHRQGGGRRPAEASGGQRRGDGREHHLRRDINLGIAVALDWGLIVPVIKHADELSLLGIARAINDLGERARTKKLSPDEVQKGTFTITNPGVFGSVIGTPIINQPQAAILCVGAIEKQPAVITVDGTDTLAIRTKGMLSLAFDHRIVDGADADRFMADVKRSLQEFPEGAV